MTSTNTFKDKVAPDITKLRKELLSLVSDNSYKKPPATFPSVTIQFNATFCNTKAYQVTSIGYSQFIRPRKFFPSMAAVKSTALLSSRKGELDTSRAYKFSRMSVSQKKLDHSGIRVGKQKSIGNKIQPEPGSSKVYPKFQEKEKIEEGKKYSTARLEAIRKAKKYLRECAVYARSLIPVSYTHLTLPTSDLV
eukprot:TRINITY_DN4809_c0_g1_i10.p1 TRINITY_DN4809_c0_g1~~TRINITY_DN4809_c0_g1_i10.p1  ORF type:complete len:193 (+),score=11.16 TRINITY_DN4809_c0_g1_i10:110-688(+)